MGNILKIYHLKDEALMDLYKRLDKDLRPMPKKSDGSIDPYGLGLEDKDVDALRHGYISGVYTIEYSEGTAELWGRLNEFTTVDSQSSLALIKNKFLDVRKKIVMSKNDFIAAIREGMYPGYAVRKHHSGEFPYSTRDRFSFNNLG